MANESVSVHGKFRTGQLVCVGNNAHIYTHEEAYAGKLGRRTTKRMLALVLGNHSKLLASVIVFTSHSSPNIYYVHPSWLEET